MKIADRTPFRNEGGQIDILGRAQGTLKYGLSWYARLQAQDTVIAVLDKILGQNYILLRNVTLPDTDIDLPLVLIGPPGIYLINVAHERGVYRVRDDEWGTVSGPGGNFVPASINRVQRTVKLGRVLQIYLDRAGFKGALIVDPILMAADPGMHIESVRPAARIVLSDALERFAISMNQARPILNMENIADIAQVIVNGPKKHTQVAPVSASTTSTPVSAGRDTTDVLFSPTQPENSNSTFSADSLGFSFDEKRQNQQTPSSSSPQKPVSTSTAQQKATSSRVPEPEPASNPASPQNTTFQTAAFQDSDRLYPEELGLFRDNLQESDSQPFDVSATDQPFSPQEPGLSHENHSTAPAIETDGPRPQAVSKPKKAGVFGMTTAQLIILGAVLLFWLCAIAGFAIYIYLNFNA
jgi:hypothetical protein